MSSPEIFRALAVVCEGGSPEHARVARALGLPDGVTSAEHTEVFVLQLAPYASIHLGAEGMLGGEAADRVAGFWRALGFTPPAEPDHLASLLGLYAALTETGEAQAQMAGRALLWEHLLSWVPAYLAKLERVAGPPYAAWGRALSAALHAAATASPRPDGLPLHLREAPPLPGPESGLDELLGGLLAPVRSGIILTRSDLAGAAESLGLGLRQGERRFALRALLAQDPSATLRWLAGEADTWAREHGRLSPVLGPVGHFWRQRAETTAAVLRQAAPEADTEAEAAAGAEPVVA